MKTLLLASALVLSAAPLAAQPVVDRAQRAPSAELAPSPAPEAPPAVPDAPAVPAEMAARVAALRAVVGETRECFTYRGERDEHIADRRCPGWFAALHRGGVASAHAIGAALEDDFRGREVDFENMGGGAYATRPRIVRLLAASGGPVAATYLVRYLGRALAVERGFNTETARAAFDTLAAMAGEDLTRLAPWEDSSAAFEDAPRMAAVVRRWTAWLREASALPRAEQFALAERHNVESLGAADLAQRWAAIQRLAAVPARRAAAADSLREMLATPGLGAEARSYASRWARRQRIALAPAR